MTDRERPTYRNPVWPHGFADPFVLKARGRYYAYATAPQDRPADGEGVFPVLTSADLVHWQEAGRVVTALGAPYYRYWAPEVTRYEGQYLLYYAVHTGEFVASIRVATAAQPTGPFTDSGRDLTGALTPWAIDPHVFRDDDGRWYLYMTIEYLHDPAGRVGSGNAVVRLRDPFTVEGPLTRVTPPRHDWELFEARRPKKGGVDWYTVEGPAVLRHRGRYYEMFSGGCYYRDNYAVSYATSETPLGPAGMRDDSWRDWADGQKLLLRGDPAHAIGPGHNSVVAGPNNAELYIAYHAWPGDMAARRPCIDRLFWHGDELWTPAPTSRPQPAPAQPRLRDLFDDPSTRDSWRGEGGTWTWRDGHVAQDDDAPEAALWRREPLGPTWLLEVNMRHDAGDGSYGVRLVGDGDTGLDVLVEREGGVRLRSHPAPQASLEPDRADPSRGPAVSGVWRQALLAYSGAILTVRLDGLPVVETRAEGLTRAFALFTTGCAASFDGVTLTDCYRDEFLDDSCSLDDLGWRVYAPDGVGEGLPAGWSVRDGALEQTESARGRRMLCKGAPHERYEYGATLALRDAAEDATPALGLVARRQDGGLIAVTLTRGEAGWRLAVTGEGVEVEGDAARDLEASFDASAWHTLRVKRADTQLAVCLDGPEVLTVSVPPGPETVGLLTQDTKAAFTGVWLIGHP